MAADLQKAKASLERVQNFDTSKLARETELGEAMNFKDAIEPARRVIDLFRQFPLQFFDGLPDDQQVLLGRSADSFFNVLNEIAKFDPKQANAYEVRNNVITNIRGQYQSIFNQIHPMISYGSSRERDFTTIERDFRASMQRSQDEAAEMMKRLQSQEDDGKRILEEVRKTAAEQGVSQQAIYFQTESGGHKTEADTWRKYTIWTAIGLGAYALLSMFLHKVWFLEPKSNYETVQLAVSKVLIFAVLGYMLLLCARNFLSHKHNEIVNKHRQNALLTFNALVAAAGSEEKRDVVLTYAAACIFSPQDTGYTRSGSTPANEMPLSIIQTLPKLGASGGH